MEGAPKPANHNEAPHESAETSYNKEMVEQEALEKAKIIFNERGLNEAGGFEQAAMLVNIMEELAEEGNHNRHVIEALARMTSIIKADNKAHEKKEAYPEVAAALGR